MPSPVFPSHLFDIFDLPDFDTRMPALKAEITPRLKALGEKLAPRVSALVGEEVFPHVAQHLRRSVNPPVETWAAFAREKRAYKPFAHLRLAVNAEGFKIACYVEDHARDKELFGRRLAEEAGAITAHLAAHPEILSFHEGDPYRVAAEGRTLGEAELKSLADRLLRIKAQHASFGVLVPRSEASIEEEALMERTVSEMHKLLPLYRLGMPGKG
jgi:uncharacterized protein YktB (UPF0637 family)